jgi:8-oxo-dGTP pyrophosphatase MutT (NUDIX family)
MNDNRGELRRVERYVIRMVVLDAGNHVLLLQTRDLSNSAFGTSWELPGGGREPGETCIHTEVRELHEETGIRVEPACFGKPTWQRDVEYT